MLAAMLTFCVPTASAEAGKVDQSYTPVGKPITSAAEFAAMEAGGNYYLDNDITITETWNAGKAVSSTYSSNVAFLGTFDGNGYTVNTTVPLFANLAGTVKNLTVEGEIAAKTTHNANVAMWTQSTVVFENIHTKANILGGDVSAPLLAYGAPGTSVTVKDCVNDADITSTNHAAGFVGFVKDNYMYFENCVNNGDMSSAKKYSAGIISVAGDGTTASILNNTAIIIKNCVNHGNLYGGTGRTAGIVSYLRGYGLIENCDNYGTVENAASIAAGILGTTDVETDGTTSLLISHCRNYGDIKSPLQAAGIAGNFGQKAYAKGYKYLMFGCENHGDIYVNAPASGTGAIYACGLAAYAYGGSSTPNGVLNCINTGDIHINNASVRNAYVCAFVGYVNSASYTIKNNINTGTFDITGNTYAVSVAFYNKQTSLSAVSNNYSIATGDGVPGIAAGGNPTSSPKVPPTKNITDAKMIKIVTAEQVASGELAYLANTGASAELFFQKIGTDKAPVTTPDGTNYVEKSGNAYVNADKMPSLIVKADYPSFNLPDQTPDMPDIDDIPLPDITLPEVKLPTENNFGKVEANYAPAGTAVTSAAEFAAMSADGSYYLANDITLTASYASAFKGTFDGNGHKITTTAPLFKELAGTVKNLTVDGEIKESTSDNATVAVYVNGRAHIENVYTKANILGGANCGAIVARGGELADITVINCRNDGSVTGNGKLGGIVGYVEKNKLTVKNSVNCGSVTTTFNSADAFGAGIVGAFGGGSANYANSLCVIENCENYGSVSGIAADSAGILSQLQSTAQIKNCANYGNIVSRIAIASGIFGSTSATGSVSEILVEGCVNNGAVVGVKATGIVARLGRAVSATERMYSVRNCVNNGDIYGITFTGVPEASYVCGIVGYAYGGTTFNELINCVNTGKIVADLTKTTKEAYVAGILGYVNGGKFKAQNNINTGAISVQGSATVAALTLYNKTGSPYECYNNYSIKSGSIPVVKIGTAAAVGERLAATVTEAQLASGELAYLMNEVARFVNSDPKMTVAYQNIGEDALPSFDSTHKLVYLTSDGKYTNEKQSTGDNTGDEITTAPGTDETTKTPDDVTTKAPDDVTTEAPDVTTEAPDVTTEAPDVTTEAPKQNGCGGVSLATCLVSVMVAAFAAVALKKKY